MSYRVTDWVGKLSGSWTTVCWEQYLTAVHLLGCMLARSDIHYFEVLDGSDTETKKNLKIPSDTFWEKMDSCGENQSLESWFCSQKRPSCAGLAWGPPFCSHSADQPQNFVNIVTRWSVHVCQIWLVLIGISWSYSWMIVFWAPKSLQYGLKSVYRPTAYI